MAVYYQSAVNDARFLWLKGYNTLPQNSLQNDFISHVTTALATTNNSHKHMKITQLRWIYYPELWQRSEAEYCFCQCSSVCGCLCKCCKTTYQHLM